MTSGWVTAAAECVDASEPRKKYRDRFVSFALQGAIMSPLFHD